MGVLASNVGNRLKAGTMFCLLAVVLAGGTVVAADPVAETTRFKAAITTIIVRSTEWPESAFTGPDEPLVLGLIDAPPAVVRIFEEAFADLPVGGRTVAIRPISNPAEATGLHAIYFHSLTEVTTKELMQKVVDQPVLTLGDADEFYDLGGIVNYRLIGAKMRFQFNREAMERAGIRVSAQVIRLAVEPPKKGGHP